MLGFAPLSAATFGGAGVIREVLRQEIAGLQLTAQIGAVNVTAAVRLTDTPNRIANSTVIVDGSAQRLEHPFHTWTNYRMLGWIPQPLNANGGFQVTTSLPQYDYNILAIDAQVTSEPITYQGAHAPLVNGDYTFTATVNDAGLAQYRQPPHLRHLPETITNSAATISSLADPLLATLTFPATDPTLFNVIVGQFQTVNTFDPTNSDTFFDSLINASAGNITLPGENKSRELFHLSPDKGFGIGPVSVGAFGTDKTNLVNGAAWVLYGLKLQPQITASHNADGTPVSQEHTLLVTASIGAIQANVGLTSSSFGIAAAVGSTQENVAETLSGLQIGTMLTPDPPWYLNPSRVQLVAQANQAADSAVYPYLAGPFDTGALQNDFGIALSLGVLAGPIGVDVPVPGVSATTTLGVVAVSSDNALAMSSLQAIISTSLSDVKANVTEILSNSLSASISLGTTSQSATSNAVATTLAATLSTSAPTATGDANTGVSGVSATLSLGDVVLIVTRYTSIAASLNVTQTIVARNFIDAQSLPQVAVSAETLAGFFRDGQAATAVSCSATATGRLLWEPVADAGVDPWATVSVAGADPWVPQSGGNLETPANIWQNAA